ncbi:hypothetical protein A6R68_05602, partial [Neotoma lepida]
CPDPPCKQDLLAYLEQIKFYSHQLKICSQVKAEIQNLGGELIMSAVSTAWDFHHYTEDTRNRAAIVLLTTITQKTLGTEQP